jgi:tRNA(fMet)-specific endonuclease VapC
MMHLDSCFVIDLLREAARRKIASATRFLERAGDEEMVVSVHVACELLAGAELSSDPPGERERVARFLSHVRVAHTDARFPDVYAQLLAPLERRGQRVSAFDLLIAAAAVVDDAPLVTRNAKDFARVPGLRILAY